ncbi:hypothetical protein ANCDUO_07212 [Ancylostoma duodenale]|uniref:Uncharacterized protein n=1 Tax=Ancylostoma duodenale TaxID=51022 RepID=A0A0C2GU43_9BILA|nr:hypothetical protein ANCDUO_07212 [Ancylostoma duodenale]
MADDLHDVATYLADMRLCFILVTATGYLLLFVYLIMLCIRRNRRTQPRRRNWDYQEQVTLLQNHLNNEISAIQSRKSSIILALSTFFTVDAAQ